MSTTAIFSYNLLVYCGDKKDIIKWFFGQLTLPAEMWKNIFIESCLLSALIFGGFYIQSKIIRAEINSSDRSIQAKLTHISGGIYPEPTLMDEHLSGEKTSFSIGHLSGEKQNLTTK